MAFSTSPACDTTAACPAPNRFALVRQSFLSRDDLPFADVLTEDSIQAVFDNHGVHFAEAFEPDDVVYTPAVTLWAFLSQMLFTDVHRSCRAAAARVATYMAMFGRTVSDNGGAFCAARAKIPAVVLQDLTYEVADGCEHGLSDESLWLGRHVFLVDGTTFSMPDTPENQAEWPQPKSQAEGLGFPIARLVTVLSLATGMLVGANVGPYAGKETGETALFRQLLDCFQEGDVIVADRFYCSYFMIALAQQRGLDVVFRQHQIRKTDFSQGKQLGRSDHVVKWERPPRPDWMDQETYDAMPEELEVRETKVQVSQPGFRTQTYVVATTMSDHDTYSAEDIGDLYHSRWHVEITQADCVSRTGLYQLAP